VFCLQAFTRGLTVTPSLITTRGTNSCSDKDEEEGSAWYPSVTLCDRWKWVLDVYRKICWECYTYYEEQLKYQCMDSSSVQFCNVCTAIINQTVQHCWFWSTSTSTTVEGVATVNLLILVILGLWLKLDRTKLCNFKWSALALPSDFTTIH